MVMTMNSFFTEKSNQIWQRNQQSLREREREETKKETSVISKDRYFPEEDAIIQRNKRQYETLEQRGAKEEEDSS